MVPIVLCTLSSLATTSRRAPASAVRSAPSVVLPSLATFRNDRRSSGSVAYTSATSILVRMPSTSLNVTSSSVLFPFMLVVDVGSYHWIGECINRSHRCHQNMLRSSYDRGNRHSNSVI
ncbi:hypothetical protein DPMN_137216 [Dreissena polymorpha]|uniref:Uncharacterized protein n=1 Tax=Dreissena polymorpha TaxID=45954 RepID=A0A9D4G2D0_DREPO|nr:hypothetical protein DPMN_137216 [Dreissena polymorpha]